MIIGIDLGTTNSVAAVWRDEKPVLIPNSLGKFLTPSVVGVNENDEILTGEAAKEYSVLNPENTAECFKRYIGTEKEYKLGKRSFRAEELSALILSAIKNDAEIFLGKTISEAIISVPAYFNDTQRKATRIAGEMAGFKVDRLINEPTAAALSYGLHLKEEESTFLVFDLGGGTFDISILEMFEGVMEVRASAGDNFLGGEDFRKNIYDYFLSSLTGNGLQQNDLLPVDLDRIDKAAEKSKRILSREKNSEVKIQINEKSYDLKIDRLEFEKKSAELIERIKKPILRAMNDSKISKNELDAVILVGGATRMPLVSNYITKVFGRFPNKDVDPDLVVAAGAAIQGALKKRDKALNDVVLTDVCPYTLGIEIAHQLEKGVYTEGRFLPIIERNSTIPCSRVDYIEPVNKKTKSLNIKIYQGESYKVVNNIFLGDLSVKFPSSYKKEDKSVEVRFTYDINGILEVEGKLLKDQDSVFSVVIEENPGTLTKEEIQKRLEALKELKIHPRDLSRNKAILDRAERLYEEYLGEERDYIGNQISIFQAILDKQNDDDIEEACARFVEILDEIESM